MPGTVAIIQSNYIPWKGYFDIIDEVDVFVLYDEVQFTKRDWRNRNKIKTAQGTQWLTIPVVSKGRFDQPIDEVEIAEPWSETHWRSIEGSYRKAAAFQEVGPLLKQAYESVDGMRLLTDVNRHLLQWANDLLGITTPMRYSREYPGTGHKTDRLLQICQAAGADRYISGPAAKAYMEVEKFTAAGIAVDYKEYDGYPPYPQLYGPFDPFVSIVDLLLNTGRQARDYIKRTAIAA